jgi:hypothetical protein
LPSCDWDIKNLPQYADLISKLQQNDPYKSMDPNTLLNNVVQIPVQTFVKSACLELTNGTMMVECFPELGSVKAPSQTSYGLVSCGFTNNSTMSGVGVPDGNNTFFLFVNLYYYYTDDFFPTWPDTNAPQPVTSGWMMPRNVNSVCSASSANASPAQHVSGSSFTVTCSQSPSPVVAPPVTSGPYPILGNSIQSTGPCLPLVCYGSNEA